MNTNYLPPVPSLSVISPTVIKRFNSLSGGQKNLFKTVYLALWRYLYPFSKLDAVAYGYMLNTALKQYPMIKLNSHQFYTLARLWVLSAGGKQTVNRLNHVFKSNERCNIGYFKQMGLITVTSFDPAHPHLVRPQSISRSYLSFTPAGIKYYRGVVDKAVKLVRDDILNGMTGTK
jgi:hypothetical protein